MSTAKTTTSISVDLIRFETSLPFAEVISRLDVEINKAGSEDIMAQIRAVKNQEEFISTINKYKPNSFLYFFDYPHHRILQYDGVKKPANVSYVVGNPLIAQKILTHNPLAGFCVPPRLLVAEKPDGPGAIVAYHRPSTLMSVPEGENHPDLQSILDLLDSKLEQLAQTITAVEPTA
ncbi:hypothetical protein JR316_0005063 [Psilocybe cubensis]|uniref:DUF302 domain-containing protein n=2 Tax=Psilocybe cubensis TaxID=181762 RepID=A0A8H8CK78_PSICU|nr:hypothetical protein JR316_0005063 [Psilocybe cubensis]KAH9482963.1 hypothetical protein JR316_0005063 [Psilocybe cubensis]